MTPAVSPKTPVNTSSVNSFGRPVPSLSNYLIGGRMAKAIIGVPKDMALASKDMWDAGTGKVKDVAREKWNKGWKGVEETRNSAFRLLMLSACGAGTILLGKPLVLKWNTASEGLADWIKPSIDEAFKSMGETITQLSTKITDDETTNLTKLVACGIFGSALLFGALEMYGAEENKKKSINPGGYLGLCSSIALPKRKDPPPHKAKIKLETMDDFFKKVGMTLKKTDEKDNSIGYGLSLYEEQPKEVSEFVFPLPYSKHDFVIKYGQLGKSIKDMTFGSVLVAGGLAGGYGFCYPEETQNMAFTILGSIPYYVSDGFKTFFQWTANSDFMHTTGHLMAAGTISLGGYKLLKSAKFEWFDYEESLVKPQWKWDMLIDSFKVVCGALAIGTGAHLAYKQM